MSLLLISYLSVSTKDEGIQFRQINFRGATNSDCQSNGRFVSDKNPDKKSSWSALESIFGRPRQRRYAHGTVVHFRILKKYLDIQL